MAFFKKFPEKQSFVEFLFDQLAPMRGLHRKAMFGGTGLYQGDRFFGIVHEGRLYFKTNEETREAYLAYDMEPFRPNARQALRNYYEVPVEIIEDSEKLLEWALLSVNL
jgi:DNA transformation protein